jgi:hypothetical protein
VKKSTYHQGKVAPPVVRREAGMESIWWQPPNYASPARIGTTTKR